MKVITFSIFAAIAAMAQVTLPPNLNQAVNIGVDLDDPCVPVATRLSTCAMELNGLEGLWDPDPNSVLGCLCCSSQVALARAYSSCADYLRDEFQMDRTAYMDYEKIYSRCQFDDCGAATVTATDEEESTATVETATEAETETEAKTQTETGSGTEEPTGSETEPTGTEETGQPEPTDAGVQLRVCTAAGLVVVLAFAAVW